MSRRLRVVWASPLRPVPSGISAYAEDLIPRLGREIDLTVLYDGFTPDSDFSDWPVTLCPAAQLPALYARLPQDLLVSHMGNNPHHEWIWRLMQRWRGLVVLHDTNFSQFLPGHYLNTNQPGRLLAALIEHHGEAGHVLGREMLAKAGTPAWEAFAPRMFECSMTGVILDRALRAVVHSAHAAAAARCVSPLPVDEVPMNFVPEGGYLPRGSVRPSRFKLPDEVPLILSLGFVAPHKRLDRVIAALGRLRASGRDFRLLIAGQTTPELVESLDRQIAAAGLTGRVVRRGFVSEEEMYALLAAADIAVNLRYPTAGESSAALIRLMGAGLPVLVTDHGASAEVPDDTVIKIRPGESEMELLTSTLANLLDDAAARHALGARARAHVLRENHVDRAVAAYLRIFEDAARDTARPMLARAARQIWPAVSPLANSPVFAPLIAELSARWAAGGEVEPGRYF